MAGRSLNETTLEIMLREPNEEFHECSLVFFRESAMGGCLQKRRESRPEKVLGLDELRVQGPTSDR